MRIRCIDEIEIAYCLLRHEIQHASSNFQQKKTLEH